MKKLLVPQRTGCPIHRGLYAVGGSLLLASSLAAQSIPGLKQQFLSPPADSKPMVRWWWFGPAVTRPEITRELEQMQHDGIGGVEMAFVYPLALDDPARNLKNLPFVSPAMLDEVRFAQSEGRRLGLRVDVTLGSGWPYGGPATTLEEAATRLKTIEIAVPPNTSALPQFKLQPGDQFLSAAIVPGEPHHWQPAQAQPLVGSATEAGPIQPGAPSFAAAKGGVVPALTAPTSVQPSPQPRVALLFYLSHTRQQVKRASVGAEGFVLDPFSHQAVATHLQAVGEPLVKAFGDKPPFAVFSDSLEAYGADWTPALPEEFRKRRGYDLLPHLPELVAGGTPAADQVRHDWGETLTELVNENYLTQIDTWAKAHGTRFRSQTYGEPAVDFSSQRLVALPEGEGPQWRQFSTLRWASSANHVFGNPVTSGETYTWLHSPVFRATPLDMKLEADIDFLSGENQLIFHGWPYSPPAPGTVPAGTEPVLPAGDPGWSLYAAAALNGHNPWHPVMPAVTSYLTRVSWLLRQGQPANQVAILLPTDDAWASFSPGKVSVTNALAKSISPELVSSILSAGYNVDFLDSKALETAGAGTHRAIVIPPTTRIPVAALGKLAEFRRSGGQVLIVGQSPTLDSAGRPLPMTKHPLGTVVADAAALGPALNAALPPDLQTQDSTTRDSARNPTHLPPTFGYIRRTLPDADIYFLANTGNTPLTLTVQAASRFPRGEFLNPETGAAEGSVAAAGIPLTLPPYASRILLFSTDAPPPTGIRHLPMLPVYDLSRDWTVRFPALGKTEQEPTRTDWTADPATLHYSGEAVYSRTLTLPSAPAPSTALLLEIDGGEPLPGQPGTLEPTGTSSPRNEAGMPNPAVTRTGPGVHAYYDPPLHEAALVLVNGQAAGALWHPPYQLDVTRFLHAGENRIELHVYNTALNAWSALPPRDYSALKAKYGDRFQMQDLDQVHPIASGLLGPIRLVGVPKP